MKIDKILKNDEKQVLYTIYLENYDSLVITEEVYFKYSLYEKNEIDNEEIKKIKDEVTYKIANKIALKYVSRKNRTVFEVEKKLLEYNFDGYIIDKVVLYLQSLNYLDDNSYAMKFLKDRIKLKPKSTKMVRYELKLKGIDDYIIDQALNELVIDDYNVALGLAKKKFSKIDLNIEKNKRKFYSFLKNRGYSGGIIGKIYKELIEGEN